MTDAGLIASYLAELNWKRLAQTTVTIRKTYLEMLVRDLGPFRKVKPKDLKAWLANTERDLKASSQAFLLSVVHDFYRWAITHKHLSKDPTAKIEKPKVAKGEPHPITDEDLEKALANADGLMRCWLSLGAFAGLRCQEIALISREDVRDDDTMRIFVAHGKGSKQRWVPLAPKVLEALNGWGMPPTGRLWDMTPQRMSKAINAHLHDLGITSTAHSLRHFFATGVYMRSKDLRLTQILLGHSSPATTAIYAAADISGAADVVGSL